MKNLLFIITIISVFSVTNLMAQEKPDTSTHHEKETVTMPDSSATSEVTESAEAWNKVCPVMGKKINPKVGTVTYKGKAYGFCCEGCDAKFAKDPAKYEKNLNENGTRFIGKK
jgi:YHS domain-containing protein